GEGLHPGKLPVDASWWKGVREAWYRVGTLGELPEWLREIDEGRVDQFTKALVTAVGDIAERALSGQQDVPHEGRPSPARQEPPRKGRRDKRDEWIYKLCCKRTPYKEIIAELAKHKEWEKVSTIPGIRQRAIEYARRNGLPEIPRRQ